MDEICSVEQVSQAVLAACSQDYSQVKAAQDVIASLEIREGFFPILAELSLATNIPLDVKRMAAICLKNGAARFWRSVSPNSIRKNDKEKIREILLRCHTEERKEVFDQLIEVVTKVGRYDFPRSWTSFLPSQMQVLQTSPDEGQKLRALALIYKVMKMLSTKRLSSDKKAFRETTEMIFPVIGSLWESYLRLFNSSPTLTYLQPSLVSIKLLKLMLTFGFDSLTSSALPRSALEMILKIAGSQLEHRLGLADAELVVVYDKYLLAIVKTLINVQERFPVVYGQYMTVTLEFAYLIAFQYADRLEMRLTARALHLLSGIMLCESYDVFKLNNQGKDVSQESIKFTEVRDEFFSESRLREMCEKCISKFLKLTEIELQNWQESPEEFAFEETRHVSLFNIKAASEHFLLNMTAIYQDKVCPYIVSLITGCAGLDRGNLDTVLLIDSIYSVTVICSYDLFDHVDVDTWFHTLVAELAQESPYSAILRRRILEVIGRWVTIKLSQEKHTAVYETCLSHMAPGHDLVVRLTAASALKAAVGDFAFYPPSFSAYLEVAVNMLYGLLKEVEECQSRVKVLEVLNAIIDGCGKMIVEFVEPLIAWMPGLWEVSTDHVMLQIQLLTTARKLTKCLGAHSPKLYTFTDPVLKYVVTQDREMILLEDGIALWLSLLENAPLSTPSFIAMFEWLSALLQLGSDSLKTSLLIIDCSILLDPPATVSRYGPGLIASLLPLYREVTGEAKVLTNNIILSILRSVPREQWPDMTPLLQVILQHLHEHSDFSKVLTMNLNVFWYLILMDYPYFSNLIASFNDADLLNNIVEIWMSKSQHFYLFEQHKLSLIAMLTLVTNRPELINLFFTDLINMIERSTEKCTSVDDKGVRYDVVIRRNMDNEDDLSLNVETEDYKRRRILESADLISKIDILTFLRIKFGEIQRAIGVETFNTRLSVDVGQAVTDKITKYLS